ncbi:MAG: hypothetical protein IPI03_23685 [Rubrivivax sp.]|nr:hypothetical protein [Rubrivivax sp.]
MRSSSGDDCQPRPYNVLAVTEATLGAMRAPAPPLARASVSARVVPGGFDHHWVGGIAKAARGELQNSMRACD